MSARGDRHAFISYVREDAPKVDRMQVILEAAGIRVWRDTADLWPGEDWRLRIRQAITDDALAFIACFSNNSAAREASGQNEELVLAIEQLRRRLPGDPWLIPVRFDGCEVPDIDIGGGRTLGSIQRVDLTGDGWDAGAARLVAAVLRILGRPDTGDSQSVEQLAQTAEARVGRLKAALRDPGGDITAYDLMMATANSVHEALSDLERFPANSERIRGSDAEAALFVAELVHSYVAVLDDFLDFLITGCAWGQEIHERIWSRAIERVAAARVEASGMVVLNDLRWFPVQQAMYAGGIAAVRQSNYGAFRALLIDAVLRDREERVPPIARSYVWRPFSNFPLAAQVLAYQAGADDVTPEFVEELRTKHRANRYTPIADFFHDTLRSRFRTLIPDDADYSDAFDHFEILLAVVAIDARAHRAEGTYVDPVHCGRFTWRDRHARDEQRVEQRFRRELQLEQEGWGPLRSGLFGGSIDRAAEAFEAFIIAASKERDQRW